MPCHLEPQQLPTAMTQDQESKQSFKPHGWNHAHIDGSNRIGVVQKKRSAKTAMAACALAPCIWRLSTEPLRTQALGAHRGFEVRPIRGFPCSSAGSDHTNPD